MSRSVGRGEGRGHTPVRLSCHVATRATGRSFYRNEASTGIDTFIVLSLSLSVFYSIIFTCHPGRAIARSGRPPALVENLIANDNRITFIKKKERQSDKKERESQSVRRVFTADFHLFLLVS